MAQISKLAQLISGILENQALDANELVVDSITLGGLAGTNLSKTQLDTLLAQTHAPQSDNQNVVAGAGMAGGGSGPTVTLNVQADDGSIGISADGIAVVRDAAGAVGLGGSGILVNVDDSTIERNTNAIRVKDSGITTPKLANNAVDTNKLSSSPTVDADRAVSTNHIKDGAVTDVKVAAGIDATKIGTGSVDNTELDSLNGIDSNVQDQLDGKQATGNYITALTGDVAASGPGSASATIQPNSVDAGKLNASVAGAGLSGGGGSPLSVNVDASTIEIDTDTLRVKDAGITTPKLANAAVDSDKLAASVAGGGLTGGAGSPLAVGAGNGLQTNADSVDVIHAPLIQLTLIAGEAFAANTSFLVRWALTGETAGRVYKADSAAAQAQGKFYAMGMAMSVGGVSAGGSIPVHPMGSHTLGSSNTPFAGADVGKPIYVTTTGAFSITPPVASAAAVYRAGIVQETTKVWIGLQQLNGINP